MSKKQLQTLKVEVKQSKISGISTEHTEDDIFEKQGQNFGPLQILSKKKKKMHLNERVKCEMPTEDVNVAVL
jgi:hypothetical protein